jgi:hypothetical protein
MQLARPASAVHPRQFGRGPTRDLRPAEQPSASTRIGDDLKLFATTFAAGFVVVSVLLA